MSDAENNTGGVDAMLVALNGRYQNVMIYNAGARWVVTFNAGESGKYSEDGVALAVLLREALAWVPKPVFSRRPLQVSEVDFEPYRDGSAWRTRYRGQDAGIRVKTKRACGDYVAGLRERLAKAEAEWFSTVGPQIAGKVEGVDFLWRS